MSCNVQGDTLGNLKHGHGRLTCTNGDVYTGQWRYDKRDGTGHAVFVRQKSISGSAQPKPICYEGGWSNDRTHGYSTNCKVSIAHLKPVLHSLRTIGVNNAGCRSLLTWSGLQLEPDPICLSVRAFCGLWVLGCAESTTACCLQGGYLHL